MTPFEPWLTKLLAFMGTGIARHHDAELAHARRRVVVTAKWNHRRARRIQSAALDAIDQQQQDLRPGQMMEDATKTRQMMNEMLGRMQS